MAELRAWMLQEKINAAQPESPSSPIPSILMLAEVAHLRKDIRVRQDATFDSLTVHEREINLKNTWKFFMI